jgi:hypothetical protein
MTEEEGASDSGEDDRTELDDRCSSEDPEEYLPDLKRKIVSSSDKTCPILRGMDEVAVEDHPPSTHQVSASSVLVLSP